jgi:hypothetical protein
VKRTRRRIFRFQAAERVARHGILLCALTCVSAARADPSSVAPAVGYNYQEIETPRSAAVSGAVHALSSSIEGLFLNPANMTATRVYHLAAIAQIWPESRRQSYGVAAVDSIGSSARLAGGIGATYNIQDPDRVNRRWTDVRFALAYPLSDQFLLGVGGRYLSLRQDGVGPLGASVASSGLSQRSIVRGLSVDVGATFKPADGLAVSLVGTNLNNPNNGFQPLGLAGGVGYATDVVSVEADLGADFTTFDQTKIMSMAGVELLLGDHFPLRAGYRYDEGAQSHALSFGTGYVDRLFSAEIGLRRVVSGESATAIVFGFTYHLESTGLSPTATETF